MNKKYPTLKQYERRIFFIVILASFFYTLIRQ